MIVPRCGHGILDVFYGDDHEYTVTCSLVVGHRGQHIGRRGDEDKVYGERDIPPASKVANLG